MLAPFRALGRTMSRKKSNDVASNAVRSPNGEVNAPLWVTEQQEGDVDVPVSVGADSFTSAPRDQGLNTDTEASFTSSPLKPPEEGVSTLGNMPPGLLNENFERLRSYRIQWRPESVAGSVFGDDSRSVMTGFAEEEEYTTPVQQPTSRVLFRNSVQPSAVSPAAPEPSSEPPAAVAMATEDAPVNPTPVNDEIPVSNEMPLGNETPVNDEIPGNDEPFTNDETPASVSHVTEPATEPAEAAVPVTGEDEQVLQPGIMDRVLAMLAAETAANAVTNPAVDVAPASEPMDTAEVQTTPTSEQDTTMPADVRQAVVEESAPAASAALPTAVAEEFEIDETPVMDTIPEEEVLPAETAAVPEAPADNAIVVKAEASKSAADTIPAMMVPSRIVDEPEDAFDVPLTLPVPASSSITSTSPSPLPAAEESSAAAAAAAGQVQDSKEVLTFDNMATFNNSSAANAAADEVTMYPAVTASNVPAATGSQAPSSWSGFQPTQDNSASADGVAAAEGNSDNDVTALPAAIADATINKDTATALAPVSDESGGAASDAVATLVVAADTANDSGVITGAGTQPSADGEVVRTGSDPKLSPVKDAAVEVIEGANASSNGSSPSTESGSVSLATAASYQTSNSQVSINGANHGSSFKLKALQESLSKDAMLAVQEADSEKGSNVLVRALSKGQERLAGANTAAKATGTAKAVTNGKAAAAGVKRQKKSGGLFACFTCS